MHVLSAFVFRRPGRSQGLLYNHLRHSFNHSLSDWSFVKIYLRRRHTLVGGGASTHKKDYVGKYTEIINLKGHQNRTTCSRVMAIFLKGKLLSIGGVASGRVCTYSMRSILVSLYMNTVSGIAVTLRFLMRVSVPHPKCDTFAHVRARLILYVNSSHKKGWPDMVGQL